jgi:protein-tyrosine phosphatase
VLQLSRDDAQDEAVTIHHYYFDAWPDHGVPTGDAVEKLRKLVYQIGQKREELGGEECEVWVHW